MNQDSNGWSIDEGDISWWNSYTRLYVQEIYSKDPRNRMARFYFRPINIETASFYSSCGNDMLLMMTNVQMTLLEECCKAYSRAEHRPCQLFFKAELRVLPCITEQLISLMNKLQSQRVELILDLDLPQQAIDNSWQRSLFKIVDSGHVVCLSGYNWKDNHPHEFNIYNNLFKYFRLGPPPSSLAEVNHFIDTCFYLKERLLVELILDRVQSQKDLDVVCRTPFFGLMGDYISRAYLSKGFNEISLGLYNESN